MADRLPVPLPRTVEEIFEDYCNRRTALLTAFLYESGLLRRSFITDHPVLGLYGFPDGTWSVLPPPVSPSTSLPEPLTGLRYLRGIDQSGTWLRNAALYSNLWLIKVAFFFAAKALLGNQDRMNLFRRINELPPLEYSVDPDKDSTASSSSEGSLDSTAGN